jgi:hypothetical protein
VKSNSDDQLPRWMDMLAVLVLPIHRFFHPTGRLSRTRYRAAFTFIGLLCLAPLPFWLSLVRRIDDWGVAHFYSSVTVFLVAGAGFCFLRAAAGPRRRRS